MLMVQKLKKKGATVHITVQQFSDRDSKCIDYSP